MGRALAETDLTQKDGIYSFRVRPGGVYELRIALQFGTGANSDPLSITDLAIAFHDREGCLVDPHLIADQPLVSNLDPVRIETLPPCEITDQIMAGALASRLFIAPPDAVEMRLGPIPNQTSVLRIEVNPLDFNWASETVQTQMTQNFARQMAQRCALLQKMLAGADGKSPAETLMRDTPPLQLASIFARFKPGGDWTTAPTKEDLQIALDDYRRRMTRLRAQTDRLMKVGYIGSDRGYERLDAMTELYRLRRSKSAEQLSLLDLDLIVIETGMPTGPDDPDREWLLDLSSLDGDLPEAGAELLDLAQSRDIPVHLWVTVPPDHAPVWRGLASRVTRIIAEGPPKAWDGIWDKIATDVQIVPHATNPAACSVASIHDRRPDLMLMPATCDIFQSPELADLMSADSVCDTLLSEFRYRFNGPALSLRLNQQPRTVLRDHTRSHERLFLQSATLVLLPAQSLRPDEDLINIAMDAIASGAIPILFGTPRGDDPLLQSLDRVFNITDLVELQALYRIRWLHERRWRGLMRYVMDKHVWRSEHRAAVLGRDPYPDGFDTPKISAVMITRRPHLLKDCLESFRKQSWPNKELVLVLNTGVVPADLPALRDNEHVMALPVAANIGECLNRAIGFSTGRYWAKMDDDDFYSRTYLEETVNYYRSAQADSVGRHSSFYYFSGPDETHFRTKFPTGSLQLVSRGGHVSGASLSGDRKWLDQPFSFQDRNAADSNWVQRLMVGKYHTFCADSVSLVVFRDRDETAHTWQMTRSAITMRQFAKFCDSTIYDRLEQDA